MFPTILLASSLLAGQVYAAQLNSYNEVDAALSQGKQITFVVDFDKCLQSNKPARFSHRASWKPLGVLIHDGVIQARGATYSDEIKSMPGMNKTLQAYDYRFDKNNVLRVTSRFLDSVTHEEKAPPAKLTCQLGVGVKIFS